MEALVLVAVIAGMTIGSVFLKPKDKDVKPCKPEIEVVKVDNTDK